MRMKTFDLEKLKETIKSTTSVAQVLIKLGLKGKGSHKSVVEMIRINQLDISHFTGAGWARGKKLPRRTKTDDYLSNKVRITSHKLRLRLLDDKILSPQCSSCNLTEWLGNPMPLELDHVDGNHKNNELSNLRLLCPNCHVFTPTYKTKNWKK